MGFILGILSDFIGFGTKKVIFHDIFDVGIGANSITTSLGIFECRIYLVDPV